MTSDEGNNQNPASTPEAEAAEPSPHQGLLMRLASAVLLIPLSLFLVYLGGWALAASLITVSALMAFEWNRLVLGPENRDKIVVYFVVYTGFITGSLALGLEGYWQMALGLTALAAVIAFVLGLQHKVSPIWPFLGVPYLFLPMISILWLRETDPDNGLLTIIWILLVVWGSDTGGYVAGKSLGGPKLAPTVSPNKTWSGFLGGVALAILGGLVIGLYLGEGSLLLLLLVSAFLSVISQVGDLVESSVKRRYGVKDFSSLIPGHGGVLDRFDGLLFVAAAAAVIQVFHVGSILIW